MITKEVESLVMIECLIRKQYYKQMYIISCLKINKKIKNQDGEFYFLVRISNYDLIFAH